MVKPEDPPPPSKRSQKIGAWIHDDLLIEIANRLPAKDVLRWRCVSKKWRDLTSTVDFGRLHVRHNINIPAIIFKKDKTAQFLDNWLEPADPVIHCINNPLYDKQFSQDGFLVMKFGSVFFIMNPLNREEVVKITHDSLPTGHTTNVYGFFWNPKLKEYCVIFVYMSHLMNSEYSIVNLGSNTCLREIKNPWNHKISCLLSHPLLIDNYLYRMVFLEDVGQKIILEFDVMSEEFTRISCPRDVGRRGRMDNIELLNIDGKLSLVRIKQKPKVIRIIICTLKDRERQAWICSSFNIRCCCELPSRNLGLKTIAFVDGKLVIGLDNRLFLCDLSDPGLKTIAVLMDGKLVIGSDGMLFPCDFEKAISKRIGRKNYGIPHVMSVASLRDRCKSETVLPAAGRAIIELTKLSKIQQRSVNSITMQVSYIRSLGISLREILG